MTLHLLEFQVINVFINTGNYFLKYMARATETERINVNIYIDKAVAHRLHEFARQQAIWKGRLLKQQLSNTLTNSSAEQARPLTFLPGSPQVPLSRNLGMKGESA